MKQLFITLLILIVATTAFAQTNSRIVEYFDKAWVTTTDQESAFYYRTIDKKEGKFLLKDFYAAGNTLQMEALCSSISPLVQDGPATWYYPNGSKEREGNYLSGNPVGLHKSYYESGSQREEVIHIEKKEFFIQHWSETGQAMLTNGTGLIIAPPGERPAYYTEVKDSVKLCVYSISSDSQDTVYAVSEVPATYQGGMPAFYRGVSKSLTYPKYSRRKGIEGKVFVQFVIDKQGALESSKVIRGIGGGCDEAALEACLKQRGWVPGRNKGKPVKTRMTLPIIFKLT
jgi:TonB family protein